MTIRTAAAGMLTKTEELVTVVKEKRQETVRCMSYHEKTRNLTMRYI